MTRQADVAAHQMEGLDRKGKRRDRMLGHMAPAAITERHVRPVTRFRAETLVGKRLRQRRAQAAHRCEASLAGQYEGAVGSAEGHRPIEPGVEGRQAYTIRGPARRGQQPVVERSAEDRQRHMQPRHVGPANGKTGVSEMPA